MYYDAKGFVGKVVSDIYLLSTTFFYVILFLPFSKKTAVTTTSFSFENEMRV
jgi:hypothetical protein